LRNLKNKEAKEEVIMTDIEKIKEVLKILFGGDIPPIILKLVAIFLALWASLFLLSKIKKLWIENFWPLFYDAEKKKKTPATICKSHLQ
jgi:hypothetical protein